MAEDKKIKISAQVDDAGFKKALDYLKEINKEIREIAKNSSAGLLGGGMGSVGARQQQPGLAGGGLSPIQTVNAGGGGMVNGLIQTVTANRNLLKATADGSRDTFKVMTDGVRSAIQIQSGEIDKLQAKLHTLNETYTKLQATSRNAMSPGGVGSTTPEAQAMRVEMQRNLQREIIGIQGQLGGAQSTMGQLQGMDNYNPYSGILGGGSRNRLRLRELSAGGGWSEGNEFVGAAAPQGWGSRMMEGAQGFAGGLGNAAKAAWGTIRGVAMPVAAIAGGYELMNQAVTGRDATLAQHALWQGMDRQQRAAQTNQIYGGMGMQMKGDVNRALALGSLSATDISGAIGKESMNALLTQAYQKAKATGSLGDVKESMMDFFGGNLSNAFGSSEGMSNNQRYVRDMAKEMAMSGMGVEAANRMQQMADAKYQSQDLQQQAYRSYFADNAGSRMAQARMGGGRKISKSVFTVNDAGEDVVQHIEGSEAQLAGIGTNFSAEEQNAMKAQIRASVGGRLRGHANAILSYQAGGLNNAMDLTGNAAGYGNASTFMQALARSSSMHGARGLVDVAAAGQIGGTYQGAMMAGDMNTSGVSGMQGMMAAAAMFGGDIRSARGVGMGMSALGQYSSGRTDNLQQGINVLASVEAAGSGKLGEQEALRDMSPAQRIDLMRKIGSGEIKSDADLPEELRLQGVTVASLKKYGEVQNKFMFSRYMSSQGTAEVNEQVAAWKKEGTASLRGLHGDDLRKAITRLGVAAKASGLTDSVEAGKYMVAGKVSEDLIDSLSGGGIGDAAANTDEAKQKRRDDLKIIDREKALAAAKLQAEVAAGTGEAALKGGDSLVKMGQSLNASATAVSTQLRGLAEDISNARKAIREGRGVPAKVKPPQ